MEISNSRSTQKVDKNGTNKLGLQGVCGRVLKKAILKHASSKRKIA
jgi:hypothetical protein